MRDLDREIRDGLGRLTDPGSEGAGVDVLWRDLLGRRRRRRSQRGALAALPVVLVAVLAAGVLAVRGSDGERSDVAAGDGKPGASNEAPTEEPAIRVDSYERLREHLASLTEGVPGGMPARVVVPVRPPAGWTLETADGSHPSDNSHGTIGFDYVDRSSSRQPLPAVVVCTTTLPETDACMNPDLGGLERKHVSTEAGDVAYVLGRTESVAAWSDVEWAAIATSERDPAPAAADLLALRRTFGRFPVAPNEGREVLTDLGALAQQSEVAEVTIAGAPEVREVVLEYGEKTVLAVDVVVPFTVDRWLKPSSGPTSSELVITVSTGEEQKEQGKTVAEELAARVPVGSRAVFFMAPRPGSVYRAAPGGILFVADDGTAVSMEPTLSDEDPVGLVPLADLLEPFGAAG